MLRFSRQIAGAEQAKVVPERARGHAVFCKVEQRNGDFGGAVLPLRMGFSQVIGGDA